jgi:hypothetical protein
MIGRGIIVHAALLGVAVGASLFVWTRDKTPAINVGNVTIWNGRAADVERVAFDAKGKKVSLEARKDAYGRWFFGTSQASAPPSADAGASLGPKVTTFVSVGQADKIAEALAPLKALRELGKIGDDRAAEFGMKEPDGTLTVTIAGKERKLTVGGRTPGGADRYVRDDGSSTVYVVKGDVTRDLESGESALGERETHGFKDPDVESVRVIARGKSREVLRRGPESKRIWADPSDPEKADETVSNWIAKVDRLRPSEYLGTPPPAPDLVVRLDYKVRGVNGAFVEIAKVQSGGPKLDFVLRTERTRLWAKVPGPVGEQVEQDLGSILK